MRRPPFSTSLIVLFLLCAHHASAQEVSPSALHARVSQISDTAELRRLESTGPDISRGFAALRTWEITRDRRTAARARRYFDRVTKAEPRNAWGHYGHALSLRAEIEDEDGTLVLDDALARGLGYDATSRARRALERAVALDPALPGAAALLTTYAVDTRDGSALELSRETLETAADASTASPETLLGLARAAREMYDYNAAANAATRAAAIGGPTFAAAHLELATALASIPGRRTEAGEAYHTAINAADDSLLQRMWNDAAVIANEEEQIVWRRASTTDTKRAALRSMWDLRGALAGLTPHERAAEHYARVNHAWQNFRRYGKVGAAPETALRWQMVDRRFDDRGVIYIRHGMPFAQYGQPLQSYHVWMYFDETGKPVTYHFLRHDGDSGGGRPQAGYQKDYVLRRTIPCGLDPEIAIMDPRLATLVNSCFFQREISARLRLNAEKALATDTYNPVITRAIPFTFDWYTFRGSFDRTEVAVAIGVQLSNVPENDPALDIDVVIADTAAHPAEVTRNSASTPPIARRQSTDEIMRGHLTLLVDPVKRAAYRVSLHDSRDPQVGMVYGGTVDVRDYSGDTIMVSDIVLAEPRDQGGFIRNGQRLSLAPTQVFRAGNFRTYYEIYNLRPGASYRTAITIDRARSGITGAVRGLLSRGDGVRLQFDDVVPPDATTTLTQMRDVNAPLTPGDYVFRVTITSGSSTITRERRFTVPPT